jgi:hypothetical protein
MGLQDPSVLPTCEELLMKAARKLALDGQALRAFDEEPAGLNGYTGTR